MGRSRSESREGRSKVKKEKKSKKSKRKVAEWAKPENLMEVLKRQAGMVPGHKAIDPDQIFAPVTTCNLSEIFPSKIRKRFKKRYSTGNWTKDNASDAEIFLYRKQMGFM